jgi:prophage regulatory protein
MSRLPGRTKGPIRVSSNGDARGSANARAVAEAVAEILRLPESPDQAVSLRLLRFPAVRERTGLSRSTIWRLERNGDFPRHRRISANAVAWVEEEVVCWIHSKVGDIAV